MYNQEVGYWEFIIDIGKFVIYCNIVYLFVLIKKDNSLFIDFYVEIVFVF